MNYRTYWKSMEGTKDMEHGPPPPYTPSPDDKLFRDSPYLQDYLKKYNTWDAYHSYSRPYINGNTEKYKAWYDYCISRQKGAHDMHSTLRKDRTVNPDWKLGRIRGAEGYGCYFQHWNIPWCCIERIRRGEDCILHRSNDCFCVRYWSRTAKMDKVFDLKIALEIEGYPLYYRSIKRGTIPCTCTWELRFPALSTASSLDVFSKVSQRSDEYMSRQAKEPAM